MATHEVLQKLRIIHRCAPGADLDVTNPSVGLERQQDTAGAMPLIFIIGTSRGPRSHGQGHQHIAQELAGALIITEQGRARIIGTGILIQDVFHVPEILAGNLADAPALVQPGF